jgi:hypothetical protein
VCLTDEIQSDRLFSVTELFQGKATRTKILVVPLYFFCKKRYRPIAIYNCSIELHGLLHFRIDIILFVAG